MKAAATKPSPVGDRIGRRLGAGIGVLVLAALSVAGTAEDAWAQRAPPPPWLLSFDLSVASYAGNRDMDMWNVSTRARYRKPDYFTADFRFRVHMAASEVDGERQTIQERYTSSLGIDLGQPAALGPYISTDAEHRPDRDLTLLLSTGAGMRYTQRRSDRDGRSDIRVALLHNYEDRVDRDVRKSASWNFQFSGQQDIAEDVELSYNARFRPQHDRMDEYRLRLDTRINIRLTDRIRLSFRHEFDRNSHPPRRSPERDDRTITAGFNVSVQL